MEATELVPSAYLSSSWFIVFSHMAFLIITIWHSQYSQYLLLHVERHFLQIHLSHQQITSNERWGYEPQSGDSSELQLTARLLRSVPLKKWLLWRVDSMPFCVAEDSSFLSHWFPRLCPPISRHFPTHRRHPNIV